MLNSIESDLLILNGPHKVQLIFQRYDISLPDVLQYSIAKVLIAAHQGPAGLAAVAGQICRPKGRSIGWPGIFHCPDSGGIAVATSLPLPALRGSFCHSHDKETFHGEKPNR